MVQGLRRCKKHMSSPKTGGQPRTTDVLKASWMVVHQPLSSLSARLQIRNPFIHKREPENGRLHIAAAEVHEFPSPFQDETCTRLIDAILGLPAKLDDRVLKLETFLGAVFCYGENLGAFLCHQNRVLELR